MEGRGEERIERGERRGEMMRGEERRDRKRGGKERFERG